MIIYFIEIVFALTVYPCLGFLPENQLEGWLSYPKLAKFSASVLEPFMFYYIASTLGMLTETVPILTGLYIFFIGATAYSGIISAFRLFSYFSCDIKFDFSFGPSFVDSLVYIFKTTSPKGTLMLEKQYCRSIKDRKERKKFRESPDYREGDHFFLM